jgi:hypothetical protein
MGRGTGLNVFAKIKISFPCRESKHSSKLNYYWLRFPGFLQTRNPEVNSTSADQGAGDAALRSLPYFLYPPIHPPKETGYCPHGFTGATIEPDGKQELPLSLPPPKQSIKNSLYEAPYEQRAQM